MLGAHQAAMLGMSRGSGIVDYRTNLRLNWDFSDSARMYRDQAGTLPVLADTSVRKILNASDLSQSYSLIDTGVGPLYKPNYQNGLSVVYRSTTTQGLYMSPPGGWNQPVTWFFVYYCVASGGQLMGQWTGSARHDIFLQSAGGGNVTPYFGALSNSTYVPSYGRTNILCVEANGASSSVFLNAGNDVLAGNPSTNGVAQPVFFRSSTNGNYVPVGSWIGEIRMYSAILSQSDREAVRNFLNQKWVMY